MTSGQGALDASSQSEGEMPCRVRLWAVLAGCMGFLAWHPRVLISGSCLLHHGADHKSTWSRRNRAVGNISSGARCPRRSPSANQKGPSDRLALAKRVGFMNEFHELSSRAPRCCLLKPSTPRESGRPLDQERPKWPSDATFYFATASRPSLAGLVRTAVESSDFFSGPSGSSKAC